VTDEDTRRQLIDALREVLGLEPLYDKRSGATFDSAWLPVTSGGERKWNRIDGVDHG